MTAKPIPARPGRGAAEGRLAEMLRVDHAGELGAVHIYRGQQAVLGRAPGRERIASQLAEMEGHEQVHLSRMESLLNERRIRPTLLSPLWRAAGFALGAGTASCLNLLPAEFKAGAARKIADKIKFVSK